MSTTTEFGKLLAGEGYYRLFDNKAPYAQIVSATSIDNPAPPAWVTAEYYDWCRKGGKQPDEKFETTAITNHLPSVRGARFYPSSKRTIKIGARERYINTYQQFKPLHEPLPLDDSFNRFWEALIVSKEQRHIFFQYIAHMIQKPEERPSWSLMLPSETGTGKGFLYQEILKPIVRYATLINSYSRLTGQFSTLLENNLLIFIDDAKAKTEDTQTRLKSIMTEESVLVEHKGKQATVVPTFARMILASNELVPIRIDETERRWCVFNRLGYDEGLEGQDARNYRQGTYIAPLAKWLTKDGAIESVYKFFLEYPLDGFNPKLCPSTEARTALVSASESPEKVFLRDYLEALPSTCKQFKFEELQEHLKKNSFTISPAHLKRLLLDCNYKSSRPRQKDGSRMMLWHPINEPADTDYCSFP